ncbi:YxeA family protein [Paenibacillus sp. FSL M7-0656]|uniref:YxeA family protein n=1 Tax=Paenibacillus sp. FSL M7-0656 TaxID=2921534 RepID=UPI0030F8617C
MKKAFTILALVLVILTCLWLFFMDPAKLTPDNPAGKTTYYTTVNQTTVNKDDNGRYAYELIGYTNEGKSKTLSFSTSKLLKNGAYLKLYVSTLRGVTHWEEVTADDLPGQAKQLTSK